jgi:hypothetical protein
MSTAMTTEASDDFCYGNTSFCVCGNSTYKWNAQFYTGGCSLSGLARATISA